MHSFELILLSFDIPRTSRWSNEFALSSQSDYWLEVIINKHMLHQQSDFVPFLWSSPSSCIVPSSTGNGRTLVAPSMILSIQQKHSTLGIPPLHYAIPTTLQESVIKFKDSFKPSSRPRTWSKDGCLEKCRKRLKTYGDRFFSDWPFVLSSWWSWRSERFDGGWRGRGEGVEGSESRDDSGVSSWDDWGWRSGWWRG